jgi:hypothetical protein
MWMNVSASFDKRPLASRLEAKTPATLYRDQNDFVGKVDEVGDTDAPFSGRLRFDFMVTVPT